MVPLENDKDWATNFAASNNPSKNRVLEFRSSEKNGEKSGLAGPGLAAWPVKSGRAGPGLAAWPVKSGRVGPGLAAWPVK